MQSDSLIDSAKGWHNIQLAVMGFIGLCGVLRMGETPAGPEWLMWWSTAMSILAFITSLLSMWMVGSVAFPLYGFAAEGQQLPPSAPGRLKAGIGMTFLTIILMVLASLAGWWPSSPGEDKVEVRDAQGASACGTWVEGAPAGALWLRTPEGTITVSLRQVTDMRPVAAC
jgi:phosphatidylglycerophosphate synthase